MLKIINKEGNRKTMFRRLERGEHKEEWSALQKESSIRCS